MIAGSTSDRIKTLYNMEEASGFLQMDEATIKRFLVYSGFRARIMVGKGRGKGHRFTLAQLLGIAVSQGLCSSERGCTKEYAGMVVDCFAALNPEYLEDRFGGEANLYFGGIRRPHDKEPSLFFTKDIALGTVSVSSFYQGIIKRIKRTKGREVIPIRKLVGK